MVSGDLPPVIITGFCGCYLSLYLLVHSITHVQVCDASKLLFLFSRVTNWHLKKHLLVRISLVKQVLLQQKNTCPVLLNIFKKMCRRLIKICINKAHCAQFLYFAPSKQGYEDA